MAAAPVVRCFTPLAAGPHSQLAPLIFHWEVSLRRATQPTRMLRGHDNVRCVSAGFFEAENVEGAAASMIELGINLVVAGPLPVRRLRAHMLIDLSSFVLIFPFVQRWRLPQ